MSEDQTDVATLPAVIQGDPEMKVTRQSGNDLKRAALADDPMFNMPVIQGSPDIHTTRQSGIQGTTRLGVTQADQPLAPGVVRADRAISIDAEMGMADHPGVVPGNPDMYGDKALPQGHVYQGSPEQTTRVEGPSEADKKKAREEIKKMAEAAGFIVSDHPIAPTTDAGYPGHPGVVPGNPANVPDAQGHPVQVDHRTAPVVQGSTEEATRNEGNAAILHADKPAEGAVVDPRDPDAKVQVLGKDQLPVVKKAPIVPVIMSDRPAPPGTVDVHDPMEYQRQMAAAGQNLPVHEEAPAGSKASKASNSASAPKASKKKSAAKSGKKKSAAKSGKKKVTTADAVVLNAASEGV